MNKQNSLLILRFRKLTLLHLVGCIGGLKSLQWLICKVLYMTPDLFQRHFTLNTCLREQNNCCLCKCFIQLYYLSWLLVVSFAISITVPLVFSHTWTSQAGVLKIDAARIKCFVQVITWFRVQFGINKHQ